MGTDMTHKFVKMLGDFEKLRVYTMEASTYSYMGMTALSDYLKGQGYNIGGIPTGFMPYINAESGKIATRVAAYVSAVSGQKLSASDKQEIGNIASRYISNENDMLYDFHDGVLDWPSGSFGNDNSCWRKSYKASTPMLELGSGYGGGFAMRLFSSDRKKGRNSFYGGIGGYGRLWLLPYDDSIIVFNPYGEKLEWFLDRLINIMQGIAKEKLFHKQIRMKNENSGLYANGGASAIITTGSKFHKDIVTTRMPEYITKTCRVCRKFYARTPKEESGREEGYCQKCGEVCAVTNEILGRQNMIEITTPVTILYDNKDVTVTNGFISDRFTEQVEYCVKCMMYHGKEGHTEYERRQ